MRNDRRKFLTAAATVGMGTVIAPRMIDAADAEDKQPPDADEVSAVEDLMREHGVLNRILLIYEEGLRRLHNKQDLSPDVFQQPASLVRKFVEDYHEKLEETYIFPEFERRRQLIDLVSELRKQHQAGRAITDMILRNSAQDQFHKEPARIELASACHAFIRMYRPHEAREDTVLFPALHKLISPKQAQELGQRFEEEEDRLFGDEGFERTVEQVASIEKQLGIHDLSQFTP